MATTPVILSGEFHGQRSLVGYSPWDRKESDTTEQLTHTHTHKYYCITDAMDMNLGKLQVMVRDRNGRMTAGLCCVRSCSVVSYSL